MPVWLLSTLSQMYNSRFQKEPTFRKTTLNTTKINFIAIFLLVILFNSINHELVNAQNHDDAICLSGGKLEMDYRNKPWKGDNNFLNKYLESIDYFSNPDKVRFRVPVKFWVYRSNSGHGGSSLADLKVFMDDLNHFNKLNKTGFQFYIQDIKFINKTKRQVMGYYIEAPLQTIFRHKKTAINVYLIEKFKKKRGSKKIVKGTYNIFTKSIVLQRKNSTTGLTHEIGHYFGLLHPHRHYNKGKKHQEPVSRTRKLKNKANTPPLCEERADMLSDTPAEPKLTFLVDNDCNFIGTALKDEWGDNYQSEVSNIMSYPTHYTCRHSFTKFQKAVMLYSAAGNKNAKYWDAEIDSNNKYHFDNAEPNEIKEMASEIKTGTETDFNFHNIFLNKKNDGLDTCDWYKFEIKDSDKRNVTILLNSRSKEDMPICIFLYDNNKNLLTDAICSNNTAEINFSNLVTDFYFIKIAIPAKEGKHFEYSIEVKLE